MKKLKSLARKVAARKPRQSKRKKVAGDARFVRESGPFNSLTTGEAFSLGNFEVAIFFRASLYWPTRSRLFSRMRPSHVNHGTISSPLKSRIFVRGGCPSFGLGQYPFARASLSRICLVFSLCLSHSVHLGAATSAPFGNRDPARPHRQLLLMGAWHGGLKRRWEASVLARLPRRTAGHDTNHDSNVMMARTALSC